MSNDKQQQEEELLILKSILEEAIIQCGQEDDQFEIHIDFQLSSPISLRLHDESHQLSSPIQFLPPLILTVHFHENYPSSIDPPTFVLSSCYFSYRYLEELGVKLDRIWEENLSTPIVFQWIECLKDELLRLRELCLSTMEENVPSDDPRLMSNYDPNRSAQLYQELLDYNREKELEQFRRDYHECPICLTNNISGREMVRLYKCRHAYCRACFYDYAKMHIDSGSVQYLLCPDVQCNLALLPTEIQTIVQNPSMYEKYERLLLQKTLEKMQDIVWCPRCQQAVLTGDENDNLALCNQCQYAFCKKCKSLYHSQMPCADELEIAELNRRRRRVLEEMKKLGMDEADEERLLQEILAAGKIETTTRLCPNVRCRVTIEKNLGCDHMYCTHCNTSFLWSEAPIQQSEVGRLVEHYEADLERVQQALERERYGDVGHPSASADTKAAPLVSQMIIKRSKKCPYPTCEKFNVKHSTGNYLICQFCKRGYCFICGKAVANEKKHFGSGCKRNSS